MRRVGWMFLVAAVLIPVLALPVWVLMIILK